METTTDVYLKGGKERMKKTTKILLFTMLMLAMVFISNKSFATTGTYENLKYEITNNEVTITGYAGEITNITIPEKIEGYPVTKIDGGAFSDTGIVELVIPNSVTEIWYGAFSNCANLTTITIPSSVTFLADDGNGDGLFYIEGEGMTPFEERMTIYVEKGSYAESYAKKYNYMYKIIGNEENNETITAIIDIVDKDGETQVAGGTDEDLYCLREMPTGLNYGEWYYQLYFDEYVGKSLKIDGLGTFAFDKKGETETEGEKYIYKCKITNPEMFYKAGTHKYSVTYTVEKTNKTYTTNIEISITGLEIKTYEVKADKKVGISLTGAMGNNSLDVNTIGKQDKTYVEMASMLNVDNENMDIYAYDINVEGQYEGELTLTFDVGQEYNGRKASILHIKKDNTTEKFEAIVENGKVTVTVNGLSPFMVAIENTTNTKTETPKEETKKEHKLDETPKTGTTFEVASILLIIALISISGIVIANKYKK